VEKISLSAETYNDSRTTFSALRYFKKPLAFRG